MKNNVFFYTGRNKAGNLVGYVSRGTQMFRAYVAAIHNPRTSSQQLQRARLSYISKLGRIFKYAARIGFHGMATYRKSSEVNAFVHVNIGSLTGSTPEAVTINPNDILVAYGGRTGASFSSQIDTDSTPGAISVTITDASTTQEDQVNDKVYVVAYAPDVEEAVVSAGVARSADKVEVTYPDKWSGLQVHVYGFVAAPDNSEASMSVHIGTANLD